MPTQIFPNVSPPIPLAMWDTQRRTHEKKISNINSQTA